MSKGTKLILIIIIGLIVIAGLITYFVKWQRAAQVVETIEDENAPVPTVEADSQQPSTTLLPPLTEAERQALPVKTTALTFVERFGTFTNHSDYVNVEELTPLMTAEMQDWALNTYVPRLEQDHDPAGFFYRIITRAPAAEVLEQADATARVKVSTQRTETSGVEEPRQFLQDIVLDLIKENNTWLVDGAYWQ